MTLPKLKRKARRIWRKSVKRLGFDGLKKIAVVVLLVGLNWAGLAAIGQTAGYLSDSESSFSNIFSAASLDMTISPDGNFASGLMYPGDSAVAAIDLTSNGTLPYQYTARAEILGGEQACDYFTTAATDGVYSYSGAIGGFASPASASNGVENWTFTFNLSSSTPPEVWGQSCFFKWIFSAWQTDFTDPANGFYDTDERLGVLRIGKAVVLNEFIPNPTGDDSAHKPNGEWVELYNNSNISIDTGDWYLYDNNDEHKVHIIGTRTDTGSTIILSHGFLVVYLNGTFNLNNNADSVRLATGYPITSSVIIDSYTYTVEKPEGFSFARIPDGVGAWVDPVPTPGGPNKLVKTEEDILGEVIVENIASPSFSETLESVAGAVSEFVAGGFGQIASGSQEIVVASGSFEIVASPSEGQSEITNPAPVASGSVEPLVEPLPSPEASPEVTPEPADDGSSIQVPTEPAIPVEPVTPSAGSGQAVEPPTDPPADPPAPEPAPAPAEAPAPTPETPAVPVDSTSSPQAE